MEQNYLELTRIELVELIDKTEELLAKLNNAEDNLKEEARKAEPLRWLDFTIVLDRLAVSMTMLHDRLNAYRDDQ